MYLLMNQDSQFVAGAVELLSLRQTAAPHANDVQS